MKKIKEFNFIIFAKNLTKNVGSNNSTTHFSTNVKSMRLSLKILTNFCLIAHNFSKIYTNANETTAVHEILDLRNASDNAKLKKTFLFEF